VPSLPFGDLLTEESFDQLFRLLTLDLEIGRIVWRILQVLPTNAVRVHTLKSIDTAKSVNWASVLDSSGTFPLLYSLQILDSLLHGEGGSPPGPAPTSAAKLTPLQKKRVQWVKAFLHHGGPAYLTSALASVLRHPGAGAGAAPGAGTAGAGTLDSGRPSLFAYLFRILHCLLALDPHYVNVDVDGVGTVAGSHAPPLPPSGVAPALSGAVGSAGAGAGKPGTRPCGVSFAPQGILRLTTPLPQPFMTEGSVPMPQGTRWVARPCIQQALPFAVCVCHGCCGGGVCVWGGGGCRRRRRCCCCCCCCCCCGQVARGPPRLLDPAQAWHGHHHFWQLSMWLAVHFRTPSGAFPR
jgi:hypothetical protein